MYNFRFFLLFFFLKFNIDLFAQPINKRDSIQYLVDESKLETMLKPITYKIDSLITISRAIQKISKDSNNRDTAMIVEIDKKLDTFQTKQLQIELDFISKNKNSHFALDQLIVRFTRQEGKLYAAKIFNLYTNFSQKIKNSTEGKRMQSLIKNFKNSEVGKPAWDFEMLDINNELIKLSSYRNSNYILLDFWASWCVPCRADIPSLKEIYSKYKNKGLEILAISQDSDKDNWKKAVIKDSTQIWRHLLTRRTKENTLLNKYFVFGIPVKILIDKKGVIIGRWRGGGDENIESIKKTLQLYL